MENIGKTHRHFRHGLGVKKGEVCTPPISSLNGCQF
jgi:hypothetical protein